MEYRNINELKKLPNNPRTIKDADFKKLCKSIKNNPDYFEARPIILSNRTGELIIIAGNQRYEAAKSLKLEKVPTFLIKDLTLEKENEIIIRDNISNGDWDFDILKNGDWDLKKLDDWGLEIENKKVGDDTDIKLYRLFQLTIDFNNEQEMKKTFDELKSLGYSCNILQI